VYVEAPSNTNDADIEFKICNYLFRMLRNGGNFMIACTWDQRDKFVLIQAQFLHRLWFDKVPHVFVGDSKVESWYVVHMSMLFAR